MLQHAQTTLLVQSGGSWCFWSWDFSYTG